MTEYIEREVLKELVRKHFKIAIDAGMNSLDVVDTACAMTSLIDNVDKADVAEVRHGRWVDKMVRDWHCFECGKKVPKQVRFDGYCYVDKLNYCPNCGADMRGC